MRQLKILILFICCIFVIFQLVGCNILQDLIKDEAGTAPLGELLNRNKNPEPQGESLAVTAEPQGEQTISLYFADQSGKYLIEEKRTIPKTLSLARETVNQWLRGPAASNSDIYPVVSSTTRLLDIGIKNGVATVDLSREYLEPYSNIGVETALYGLVNTVAQFSTVELVNIRIEGKELKDYRGLTLNSLRFRNDMIGFTTGPISQAAALQDEAIRFEASSPAESEQSSEENEPQENQDLSPSSMNIFLN